MDAFQQGTTDSPTDFIAMLYRLTELHPTREQLVIMLRSNNVNIRCLGLLYLRLFGSFQDVYACLAGSFEETKLVSAAMTVGEYAMRLLDENQLNHGGLRLPRIPIKIQQ